MPAAKRKQKESHLDRAYVESTVIKTGLDRLASHMDFAGGRLRDELTECAERFDTYMRDLHQACERAGLAPVRR